jgi:dipeptidase E
MPALMLLSNSFSPGQAMLEHAMDELAGLLTGTRQALFVAYAASDPDGYTEAMRKVLGRLGVSAGANLACPTIRTTNDMPIVQPASLAALGLIPFQVNPHYPTASAHDGPPREARDRRLGEFLEENDVPVLGLCEGSWLQVSGTRAVLGGTAPALATTHPHA